MKKLNNKGFSLVELIIVIAIMAVLIGVLAPQFIRYVERSRRSTDVTNVQEIVAAIQVYASDTTVAAANRITDGAVITLTTTNTAVTATNADNNTNLALAAAGINTIGLRSANWGASVTLTVAVDATTGNVTITCSSANLINGVV